LSQYQYGQFGPEHLKKIREGLALYNAHKFWECHEYLEDHWMEDIGDQARLIYWAVIQVATALYHARDENLNGAQGMLLKAKDKLKRIEEARAETGLLKQINWRKFKLLVREVPGHEAKLEDFNELFEFRFPLPSAGAVS